ARGGNQSPNRIGRRALPEIIRQGLRLKQQRRQARPESLLLAQLRRGLVGDQAVESIDDTSHVREGGGRRPKRLPLGLDRRWCLHGGPLGRHCVVINGRSASLSPPRQITKPSAADSSTHRPMSEPISHIARETLSVWISNPMNDVSGTDRGPCG